MLGTDFFQFLLFRKHFPYKIKSSPTNAVLRRNKLKIYERLGDGLKDVKVAEKSAKQTGSDVTSLRSSTLCRPKVLHRETARRSVFVMKGSTPRFAVNFRKMSRALPVHKFSD